MNICEEILIKIMPKFGNCSRNELYKQALRKQKNTLEGASTCFHSSTGLFKINAIDYPMITGDAEFPLTQKPPSLTKYQSKLDPIP